MSEDFEINFGVRQISALSPFLVALYINVLANLHCPCVVGLLPRDVRNAKRGIAIVSRPSVRLSVCPSVCNVDVR